jgi:hypothetical protein
MKTTWKYPSDVTNTALSEKTSVTGIHEKRLFHHAAVAIHTAR